MWVTLQLLTKIMNKFVIVMFFEQIFILTIALFCQFSLSFTLTRSSESLSEQHVITPCSSNDREVCKNSSKIYRNCHQLLESMKAVFCRRMNCISREDCFNLCQIFSDRNKLIIYEYSTPAVIMLSTKYFLERIRWRRLCNKLKISNIITTRFQQIG